MIVLEKKVYYCEHCKRHRLTRHSIEQHEPRCIYNPERVACGWCRNALPPRDLAVQFAQDTDVDWLRTACDGCPACMLAVVVQSGLTARERYEEFDYKAEVERFRTEERNADIGSMW